MSATDQKTTQTRPTQAECNEWERMARAAYSAGRNATGDRFLVAAYGIASMPLATWDSLMRDYRAWLVDGTWPEVNGD